MTQSHYSLRWNNHQTHILTAFETLLHAETLVDVTLVCAETSVRAHKVVLCACSPFFEKIFAENPCKHPVIVLKDFEGWEVQAIVDFMYRGEIAVGREQLRRLMRAGESLQVRGLANEDDLGEAKEHTVEHTLTPSTSPNEFDRNFLNASRCSNPPTAPRNPMERLSPFSTIVEIKPPFPQRCDSPLPRRKQARPRRRSGELHLPQDLSAASRQEEEEDRQTEEEDRAENLCMKRRRTQEPEVKEERNVADSPDMDLSLSLGMRTSPVQMLPASGGMKQEVDSSRSPLPFPPMPSVAALTMSQPPHTKFFGVDSPLGLFPPGMDSCRNPLFDMSDPRTTPDPQMFVKKKMGRPKGQHSAPRGGPPRSWTNAELTEALQHVWNKKMTTSQASRIFGIPYNSLLMYVRGKYGKSLKLEQLRKDCIAGPPNPAGDNNNAPCKPERDHTEQIQPNTRPSSAEDLPQPLFNPFSHGFYPDFGSGFPLPVSMIHLLPQHDKHAEPYAQQQQAMDEECKEHERELFRSAVGVEDKREMVPQSGRN